MIRRLLLRCFFVWLRCRGYCYRLRFRSTLWIWGGRLNSGRRNRLLVPLLYAYVAACCAQAALGKIRPEVYAVMLDAAADVFWPQARTAAVKDTALRKACLPGLRRLRPLYPHGTEVQTRKDWKLFQTMMKTIGPRLTLWMASRR